MPLPQCQYGYFNFPMSRVDRNDDFGGYDPLKLIQMTAAAHDEEGHDLDDFDADDGVEDDVNQTF